MFNQKRRRRSKIVQIAGGLFLFPWLALASDADVDDGTNRVPANLGIFHALDPRSAYNADFFPQPLLVDDTALEEGELEFGSLDTKANRQRSDLVTAGAQKSFGLVTFEFTVPFERDDDGGHIAKNIGDLELAARYPLGQWVSANGEFDTTLGVAAEVGLPVNSTIAKNPYFEPKAFNDLKLGSHWSVQTVLGYSMLYGPGPVGGLNTFEYGLALGYAIPRSDLRLPGIEQFTPLLELSGEMDLNHDDRHENTMLGSAGFRADIVKIGAVHPSIAIGFVFPMNGAEREEVHWGIATGLTLEF